MSEDSANVGIAPIRRVTGVQIVGTGSYLPPEVVTNDDLAALGCDAEWILQRTGIRERRHAPPEMTTADMATSAAQRCLEAAGVDKSEVDLLILATCTPDRLMPATATTVQDRLGLRCGAFDLSAVCAGFTYALATGMQFIGSGGARRVLVIGADAISRINDPGDKKTYPIFGDGAGAVLLAPGSAEQGALAYMLGADGSGTELLYRPATGVGTPFCASTSDASSWYMQMEGRPVFKWAVRLLAESSSEILEFAGLERSQIDWWIFHQANLRILDAAAKELDIDRERLAVHIDRYGNTSAASVPIALDETVRAGGVHSGSHLLLSGFGAGLAWGALAWRW
ncbi:MAG: ketoacyl-ACP synthase III [Planctomycetales bacterium]|nr:ketoacyl-ACP synthase III [Planctomycetales bacterium]